MINKNTNKKNNTNKKENTMTIKNNTNKKDTMTQEMTEFVEYFKSFYDEDKDKFITTDMIVAEAEFLIEEDDAGYYVWCEGDSDDRATVYENIIGDHFKTEAEATAHFKK